MKFQIKSVFVPLFAAILMLPMASVQAKQGGQSNKSAKQYAPGQQKKAGTQTGTKSAKQYAPGQQKKAAGGTKGSAKQYAPGQKRKSAGD